MTKDAMAKEDSGREKSAREQIVAAIRRAGEELGRAPSRGELRRITGLSHYRVLSVFPTLREAVRAAGLEPNPKGEKISTEDLQMDWKRVAEKLGRRPSRAEYVREGKYSAGALTVRFGSWGKIGENIHHGDAEARRTAKRSSRESCLYDTGFGNTGRKTLMPEKPNYKGHDGTQRWSSGEAKKPRIGEAGDFTLHNFDTTPVAQLPAPLVGMRRVTVEVTQMVVNTLLGSSSWHLAFSSWPNGEVKQNGGPFGDERVKDIQLRKDRPVMGEPFDRSPMTNAPVNELGVMVLFGMVAAGLGLQVESVQAKFPDCMAKRQVAPGKWQYLRIEFEYESKNFKLHGHDPKGCDMIVCWRHNWKECPPEIEVVELCRLVGRR
jgi:hypothetical protein